ncbi:hypothetical protein DJ56_2875 [Yersinia pestis]|nr:hypothetical protein DJ56_2875 [Yersinia pestis]
MDIKGLYLGIEVYIVTPALQPQAICFWFAVLARKLGRKVACLHNR